MNKQDLRTLLISVGVCAIMIMGVLFYFHHSNKKIAVVDAIQVFNSFKMKQELESKTSGLLDNLGRRADSLKSDLSGKSKVKDFPKAELEKLYIQYRNAQGELEQTYQQTNQEINQEVWKRLNPLIDDYGKEGGYRLIIGANGMGSVLYNDDYYDRTKEVIDFVNKRYEEGK